MSRSPAYYSAGWPAEPSGYGPGRSVLHQPRLARHSQLPPQAGAWFNNSPLQFSSMRSGELLHAGTAASTRYGRHRCRVVPRHQCLRWLRLPCLWRASRARASRVCGRASRAHGNAMQAQTEAGCVESDESVASFSVSAAIIEEK